jgi:C-terminal processing protease CtpA/Prc
VRIHWLICIAFAACIFGQQNGFAQSEENVKTESPEGSAHTAGLHGSVKTDELHGKTSSMQEAALDTPDEKPEEVKTQTLKQNQRLQAGIKRSSLFAKVHHPKMTAEDFRKLEYGVLGLVAINRILMLPIVTSVFPTCPAERAGIRPGDVLISEDGYMYKPGVGQKEIWATLGGKAGTKVALTVRRGHQLVTFNLVRMNIEDIQDNRVRRQFEALLRHYGPPGTAHPDDN